MPYLMERHDKEITLSGNPLHQVCIVNAQTNLEVTNLCDYWHFCQQGLCTLP